MIDEGYVFARSLPIKQAAVLNFIRTELAAGARFPTTQRIAIYMGWKNDTSALDCLHRLRWRGLVSYCKKSRKFALSEIDGK